MIAPHRISIHMPMPAREGRALARLPHATILTTSLADGKVAELVGFEFDAPSPEGETG